MNNFENSLSSVKFFLTIFGHWQLNKKFRRRYQVLFLFYKILMLSFNIFMNYCFIFRWEIFEFSDDIRYLIIRLCYVILQIILTASTFNSFFANENLEKMVIEFEKIDNLLQILSRTTATRKLTIKNHKKFLILTPLLYFIYGLITDFFYSNEALSPQNIVNIFFYLTVNVAYLIGLLLILYLWNIRVRVNAIRQSYRRVFLRERKFDDWLREISFTCDILSRIMIAYREFNRIFRTRLAMFLVHHYFQLYLISYVMLIQCLFFAISINDISKNLIIDNAKLLVLIFLHFTSIFALLAGVGCTNPCILSFLGAYEKRFEELPHGNFDILYGKKFALSNESGGEHNKGRGWDTVK